MPPFLIDIIETNTGKNNEDWNTTTNRLQSLHLSDEFSGNQDSGAISKNGS